MDRVLQGNMSSPDCIVKYGTIILPNELIQRALNIHPSPLGVESSVVCEICNQRSCEHTGKKLNLYVEFKNGVYSSLVLRDVVVPDESTNEPEPEAVDVIEENNLIGFKDDIPTEPHVGSQPETPDSTDAEYATADPSHMAEPGFNNAAEALSCAQPLYFGLPVLSRQFGHDGPWIAVGASPRRSTVEKADISTAPVDQHRNEAEPQIDTEPEIARELCDPEDNHQGSVKPLQFQHSRNHRARRSTQPGDHDHDRVLGVRPLNCNFCYCNNESRQMYTSHELRTSDGRVTCPVLRRLVCPICQATGDNAHTQKYCPKGNNTIHVYRKVLNSTGTTRTLRY